MNTEQEYDDIIAPMLADVAAKCKELGMTIIARVEWAPGETGITQSGDLKASAGQSLAYAAVHSQGNVDKMLIHLVKNHDVSNSIFLAQYGKPTK